MMKNKAEQGEKGNEYDPEVAQPYTAYQPMAP